MKFLNPDKYTQLLKRLSKDYQVFVPSACGDKDYDYTPFVQEAVFNPYRNISTIRQFFMPSVGAVSQYFSQTEDSKQKPLAIVGVKNCDLYSLKIQDSVFLEEPVDEGYKKRRDENLIISSDCTGFKDVCFCESLGLHPYVEEMFDLNISQVPGGFLVDVGSPKGIRVFKENQDIFEERTDLDEERKKARHALAEELKKNLTSQKLAPKESLYELIKKGYEHQVWADKAEACVECGACIMNCPTCHCFLLFDEQKDKRFIRGRVWDGCQYKGFGRVAGGANPLKLRSHRLRNRYIKDRKGGV